MTVKRPFILSVAYPFSQGDFPKLRSFPEILCLCGFPYLKLACCHPNPWRSLLVCFFIFPFLVSCDQEVVQWRGPGRNGIYPDQSLLKEWPEEGPEMAWKFEGLGAGMGSPAIAGGRIYITGIPDTLAGKGTLFVLSEKGKLLWSKEYGPEFTDLFAGTRSTPAVAGNLIYIESGRGTLYCLKTSNGEPVWTVDFYRDLQADTVQFGFAESVLVDGDRLICTPGGKKNNMVALNRFTGEKIWSCPGYGEKATYTSPVLFDHNGTRIIVNLTASSIIGVNADTGELLWRFPQFQDNFIHANTPVYDNGRVLVSSASRKDNSGLVMLQLSRDGKQADILWRNSGTTNLMGGVILREDCIYLSAYLQPKWFCVDRENGEIRVVSKDLGGGAVISAGGLLYCYTEREGEVALVDATPQNFKVISRFKIPLGTGYHWAHPVISKGKLYIRHGNALMAYHIKA